MPISWIIGLALAVTNPRRVPAATSASLDALVGSRNRRLDSIGWSRLGLIASVCLLVQCLLVTPAQAAAMRLTEDPEDSTNPSVAVGPDGSIHFVWAASLKIYYSRLNRDGQVTYPKTNLYSIYNPSRPKIAVDSKNHAHVVFGINDLRILYAQTMHLELDESGNKLYQRLIRIEPAVVGMKHQIQWPGLAIDPTTDLPVVIGDMHIRFPNDIWWSWDPVRWAWRWIPIPTPHPGVDYNLEWITAFKLTDDGNIGTRTNFWTTNFWSNTPRFYIDLPAVAVDASGRVHGVWTYKADDGTSRVGYSHWNAGAFWSISRDPVGLVAPAIACSPGDVNKLHVVWDRNGAVLYTRLDTEGVVETNNVISSAHATVMGSPAIACGSNLVHVVWPDNRDGNREIYLRSLSLDTGEWQAERRLTFDPGDSMTPAVSAWGANAPAIVWSDNRDESNGKTNYEVLLYRPDLEGYVRFNDGTPMRNVRVSLLDTNGMEVPNAFCISTNDGFYRIYLEAVTHPGDYFIRASTFKSKASWIEGTTIFESSRVKKYEFTKNPNRGRLDNNGVHDDGEAVNWYTDGQSGPHDWEKYGHPKSTPDLVWESRDGVLALTGGDALKDYLQGEVNIFFPQPIVWVHGIYAEANRFYPQCQFFSNTNSWLELLARDGEPKDLGRRTADCSLSYAVHTLETEGQKGVWENADAMEQYMTEFYDQGIREMVAPEYGFPRFNVVSHSMGAPISRVWLCRHNGWRQHGEVEHYVSIAGIHGGNYAASYYTFHLKLAEFLHDESAKSCSVRELMYMNYLYWNPGGQLRFAWGINGQSSERGLFGWMKELAWKIFWKELTPHDGVNNAPSATSQNGPYRGSGNPDGHCDLRQTDFGLWVRDADKAMASVDLSPGNIPDEQKEGLGDHSFMDSATGCMASYGDWLGLSPDRGIPRLYVITSEFARWDDRHYVPLRGEGGAYGLQGRTATEPEETVGIFSSEGLLRGEESYRYEVPVDRCAEVQFSLLWLENCQLSLKLLDPLGRVIDPGTAGVDAAISYEAEGYSEEVVPAARYVVQAPASGRWTVVVQGNRDMPASGTRFLVLVDERSDLLLIPQVAAQRVRPGQQVVVQAWVERGRSGSLRGVTVEGEIERPDGSKMSLRLLDDGTHADGRGGDGVYGVNFGETALAGEYVARLRATGTNDVGESFERTGTTVFEVLSGKASFNGKATEHALDTNGNGLFDELRVALGVTVETSGRFIVTGRLVADGGRWLGGANTEVQWSAGRQSVELRFDGRTLGTSRLDGPYRLEAIRIMEVLEGKASPSGEAGTKLLWGDELPAGPSTQAYHYWEFEGAKRSGDGNISWRVGCPGDKLVNTDSGGITAMVNGIGPTVLGEGATNVLATYTLNGATVGTGQADASGRVFSKGVTIVTYTFADSAGHTNSCQFTVTVTRPELPEVQVQLKDAQWVSSWPAGAQGFVLECSPTLSPPVEWAPVTNAAVTVGDRQTMAFLRPNQTMFYRLKQR